MPAPRFGGAVFASARVNRSKPDATAKGVRVRASGENVEGAAALELEAAEQVDAAKSEYARGEASLSVDLLIDAIKKERDSLDLLEQGVEMLQRSLEQRRRSLEQQEEILNALTDCLIKEGVNDATRR